MNGFLCFRGECVPYHRGLVFCWIRNYRNQHALADSVYVCVPGCAKEMPTGDWQGKGVDIMLDMCSIWITENLSNHMWFLLTTFSDLISKFHNAPVPYPEIHHSEQKCSVLNVAWYGQVNWGGGGGGGGGGIFITSEQIATSFWHINDVVTTVCVSWNKMICWLFQIVGSGRTVSQTDRNELVYVMSTIQEVQRIANVGKRIRTGLDVKMGQERWAMVTQLRITYS